MRVNCWVLIFRNRQQLPTFAHFIKNKIMAYNLLKGKKGIIFGALDENSIAWKTAQRCHAEGAQIVLSNAPIALRAGNINRLAEEIGAPVIGADVTVTADLENLFAQTREHFGG